MSKIVCERALFSRRRMVHAHVDAAFAQLIQHLGQALLARLALFRTRNPREVVIALVGRSMIEIGPQSLIFKRSLHILGHLDRFALESTVFVSRVELGHGFRLLGNRRIDTAQLVWSLCEKFSALLDLP